MTIKNANDYLRAAQKAIDATLGEGQRTDHMAVGVAVAQVYATMALAAATRDA